MWNNGMASITGLNIPVVSNSLLQTHICWKPGTNNKSVDPLFVDPITNFRLQFTSPAINMGENSAVHDSTDLEGL